MRKFLVLGGSGYLGSRIMQLLPNSYGTFFTRPSLDRPNMAYLEGLNFYEFNMILQRFKPDVVINCLGFTNVDLCDKLPEKSWLLNANLPYFYADMCKKYDIKFIQISTDHYENPSNLKLKEHDPCTPINNYGFSKLHAERLILEVNPNALIARTNFFHFNFEMPTTFLDHIIIKAKRNQKSFSFDDVIFTPISTNNLIKCITWLSRIDYRGVINIGGSEALSKFAFHQLVFTVLGISTKLHFPVNINNAKLLALRPKFMGLDNTVLESTLNFKLPSISDMIHDEIIFAKKKVGSGVY